jgi:hypothetical protein
MKEKIKFPAGAVDVVKNAIFINMGRLFRKWKSKLNINYVKKGLVPKHMSKITDVQWKKFVQQKTNPKALTISNEYDEMLKKNIYPHHMGSKGYVAKIPEWKKKIEEVVSAGNSNSVEDIEERIVNWSLARSKLTQDGKLVHKKKGVTAVQEKAVQLNEKKRLGLFKSDRENDVLSGALSNAEHIGCIRDVASQMPWKVGFSNDAWSYKKRDRYKRNLEDPIEEKMNSMFETKFSSYMQSVTQEKSLEL